MPSPVVDELAQVALAGAGIPGLAVGAVARDGLVFAKGYGYADRERGVPARETTCFLLASPSKIVVAAVVLALAERGMLDLDEDVGIALGFPLRHPHHPSIAITLRMLLSHRAALSDDLTAMRTSYVRGDSPVSLDEWVRERLSVGARPFLSHAPGTADRYANLGHAIAARVAENAARMSFDELSRALVFRPLGMTRSSYRLRDFDLEEVARPYERAAMESYGYPDYPVGALRTSVVEFSRLIASLLGGGKGLLAPESVAALLGGLGTRPVGSLIGHEGVDLGAGTRVILDPGRGAGVILLGNSSWTSSPERARLLAPLQDALFALAYAWRGVPPDGNGGGDL